MQTTTKKVARKRGQPTKFTPERWQHILETVATYGDLIEACDKPDMPNVRTIYRWMEANPELKDQLRGAWEMFSMLGHSVNVNILRGGKLSTQDFRRDEALAAQNRWFMSKTNRRDFGDKQLVDLNSTINISMPKWSSNAEPDAVLDGEIVGDPDEVFERQTLERLTSKHQEDDEAGD